LPLEYHTGEIGFKIAINNFILEYQLVDITKNGETSVFLFRRVFHDQKECTILNIESKQICLFVCPY
jgi:hypothetical protein